MQLIFLRKAQRANRLLFCQICVKQMSAFDPEVIAAKLGEFFSGFLWKPDVAQPIHQLFAFGDDALQAVLFSCK